MSVAEWLRGAASLRIRRTSAGWWVGTRNGCVHATFLRWAIPVALRQAAVSHAEMVAKRERLIAAVRVSEETK